MKTYLVILLILIFIVPVSAQGTPPPSLQLLDGGLYDNFELIIGGLMVSSGGTFTTTSSTAYINGNASYITTAGQYAYLRFRGTGFSWISPFNGATGDICVDLACYSVTVPNTPGSLGEVFSIHNLAYGNHDIAWKRTTVFYLDAVMIFGGDLPTATPAYTATAAYTATPITLYPTPTAITLYPTPTAMELSTAISEVIAEMTVEVTVILPESTDAPYGVPMLVEGTTGTQDALFEYKATAGDGFITLTVIVLIVLSIAHLGVDLWKR